MKNKQECGVIKFFFVFLQAVKAFESKVLNKRIMAKKRLWSREEFIVVLNLYYKLPFGKLNYTTKEVKELAALIGRTDNSVAMRLSNFRLATLTFFLQDDMGWRLVDSNAFLIGKSLMKIEKRCSLKVSEFLLNWKTLLLMRNLRLS